MFRTPTDLSSKLRFACGTPEFLNVVEPIVVIFIKISSDILPRKLYFRIPLVLGGLPLIFCGKFSVEVYNSLNLGSGAQGVGVQVPSPAHYSLADLRYLQLPLSKVNFCRVLGGQSTAQNALYDANAL